MGCPVYDPPNGVLEIRNTSSEAVYVYLTCSVTLPEEPELKLKFSLGGNVFDEKGRRIIDTLYYPDYRIEPDTVGTLGVSGTPRQPLIPCEEQSVNLFFMTESIMRKYKWEEIVQGQRYQKRIQVTNKQLDSLDWEITYIPF
jgi:hypothetical protein